MSAAEAVPVVNLTGTYELDVAKSDSIVPLLQLYGMNHWLRRKAEEDQGVTLTIEHRHPHLKITRSLSFIPTYVHICIVGEDFVPAWGQGPLFKDALWKCEVDAAGNIKAFIRKNDEVDTTHVYSLPDAQSMLLVVTTTTKGGESVTLMRHFNRVA